MPIYEDVLMTFPKRTELKKLQHRCSMISMEWAVEVGILYGYKGKRKNIQKRVLSAFNMEISAKHTNRIMETAKRYVEDKAESVKTIKKLVKEHPEWYIGL